MLTYDDSNLNFAHLSLSLSLSLSLPPSLPPSFPPSLSPSLPPDNLVLGAKASCRYPPCTHYCALSSWPSLPIRETHLSLTVSVAYLTDNDSSCSDSDKPTTRPAFTDSLTAIEKELSTTIDPKDSSVSSNSD